MKAIRCLALGVMVFACAPDGPTGASVPRFSFTGDPVLTTLVFGADGNSICDFLPAGAGVVGQLINANPPPNFVGQDGFACPDNTLAMSAPAGSWFLRVRLPQDPQIGHLPVRTWDVHPIALNEDTRRDLQILPGTPLGGTATLDGIPAQGVELIATYDQAPPIGAAFGGSGPDGTWNEGFRSSLILQNGVRYRVAGCAALGVSLLEGPPAGGFLFPGDVNSINCRLTTAPAVQFSHTHTRLVVTPMPGDIGGQDFGLSDRYGLGWGVQFPVPQGQSPVHIPASASHLYGGGLLIGVAPDRILSGISMAGQLNCGASCRDLGLDGVLSYTDETPQGKKVVWRYSDALSAEGVGLRIVQQSYDGQSPHDYVLFDFTIQNTSPDTLTFYAGAFMDWDVDEDALDDYGFTDFGGHLMAVTSASGSGAHLGTLLAGAPAAGNLFYNFNGDVIVPFQPSDQFQALSGAISQPSIGRGDIHYIHGIGPITVRRGKKADIWLAVVAGENREAFLDNARAAQDDIVQRQRSPGQTAGGLVTTGGIQGLRMRGVPKQEPYR